MSLHLGIYKYVFHYVWENIHTIGKSLAIFGLGMPPVTEGKTGIIKSLYIKYYCQRQTNNIVEE